VLKNLHDRKILQHDLKPQNIFLAEESIVKFADFGIAKALEHK
jgi:serine/threonine protein kinase